MGALEQLESFLQDLLERPASLLTPRRLQPLQLASAMGRELEERSRVLADRVVAPSLYSVRISEDDFSRLAGMRSTLEHELADYVERLAAERAVSLPADPCVTIEPSDRIQPGKLIVLGEFPRMEPVMSALSRRRSAPIRRTQGLNHPQSAIRRQKKLDGITPTLTLLGEEGEALRSFPLEGAELSIGRRSDNDISLSDLKLSRHHARIEVSGREWYLRDMESTNGTRVNGAGLTGRVKLQAGDIIEVGLQRLRFDT